MDPIRPDIGEILDQLQPMLDALGRIFRSHGISVHEAETILEESCRTLVAKRLRRQAPLVWLLHDVIARCKRFKRGERP